MLGGQEIAKPLLQVKDLAVHFPVRKGVVRAVDGITFDVFKGETVGLVGESGCGKTTAGRAVLQILKPTAGEVWFEGQELTRLWRNRKWSPALWDLRKRMQMIFQDPYGSLNPRMTVESIVAEPLQNFGVNRPIGELMEQVGMDPRYIRRYPHEFSGGQRQRIGIARALALSPSLIVADEPISALDVSIQAQILNLLAKLQAEHDLTYLFIAHDLSAVRHVSDRIIVMYLGKIMEIADAEQIYEAPAHPYTKALISAIPIPDPVIERHRKRTLLTGDVPSPLNPPTGCPFHTRCPEKIAECETRMPELVQVGTGRGSPNAHLAACHLVT